MVERFRVFEEPVEVIPESGLIGLIGRNGAGKSSLLEAISWALYGKARTTSAEIKTAGCEDQDVTAVIDFEHQDHLYRFERSLVGKSNRPVATAYVNGEAAVAGATAVTQFARSILGVDELGFKSSVYAEQKELAGFSRLAPEERRRIVLRLLGIEPLDLARSRARRDSKNEAAILDELRRDLPNLEDLTDQQARWNSELEESEARLALSEQDIAAKSAEAQLLSTNVNQLARSIETRTAIVEERDRLTEEDRHLSALLVELKAELESAARARSVLEEIPESLEAEVGSIDERLQKLRRLDASLLRIAGSSPSKIEEHQESVDLNRKSLQESQRQVSEIQKDYERQLAMHSSGQARLDRVEAELATLASLGDEADCPACLRPLGGHRDSLEARLARQKLVEIGLLEQSSSDLELLALRLRQARELEEQRRDAHVAAQARLLSGQAEQDKAVVERAEISRLSADLGLEAGIDRGRLKQIGLAERDRLAHARELIAKRQLANAESQRFESLNKRFIQASDRQRAVASRLVLVRSELGSEAAQIDGTQIAQQESQLALARRQLDNLLNEISALDARRLEAVGRVGELRQSLRDVRERIREHSDRLRALDERAQRARLASTTASFLGSFRNSVVASIGPTLEGTATAMFRELTDATYDGLVVDPETFGLRVRDKGVSYDLSRFSGSEQDLANLAFRVSVARNLSLGADIGVLILDEVFGSLDEVRREAVLTALDALKARFAQVFIVTHSEEVKAHLPSAFEVRSVGERRSVVLPVHA